MSSFNEIALKRDVEDAVRELRRYEKRFNPRWRKRVMDEEARLLVEAARAKAPTSSKEHGFINAQGQKVRIIPGNLRRSIQILEFKRAPFSTFVGPKVVKRKATGTYAGSRVNAYYAHWVEFGTVKQAAQPYMRPAWDATKAVIIRRLMMRYKDRARAYRRLKAA